MAVKSNPFTGNDDIFDSDRYLPINFEGQIFFEIFNLDFPQNCIEFQQFWAFLDFIKVEVLKWL